MGRATIPGGGGTGHPLYAELGYALTNLNGSIKTYDGNAGMISFQPGLGTASLLNTPGGLDALLERLSGESGPPLVRVGLELRGTGPNTALLAELNDVDGVVEVRTEDTEDY